MGENFQRRALEFMVKLRDLGQEAKYQIDQVITKHNANISPGSQYIAASILSESELMSFDFSEYERFIRELHQNSECGRWGRVRYNRTAVLINASRKFFCSHGECRLFDYDKELLYQIIDEKLGNSETKRQNTEEYDKGGKGVLNNMLENTEEYDNGGKDVQIDMLENTEEYGKGRKEVLKDMLNNTEEYDRGGKEVLNDMIENTERYDKGGKGVVNDMLENTKEYDKGENGVLDDRLENTEEYDKGGKEVLNDMIEKTKEYDKGGKGVLNDLLEAFANDYPNLHTGFILLFSVNIPCSIDFHECARLLHMFAMRTNHKLIVGYDKVHQNTDEETSLEWLETANIDIVHGSEIRRTLEEEMKPLTDLVTDEMCMNCGDINVIDNSADDNDNYEAYKAEFTKKAVLKHKCRVLTKELKY